MKWKEFCKKHGLHSKTDPYLHLAGVILATHSLVEGLRESVMDYEDMIVKKLIYISEILEVLQENRDHD